MDIETFENQVRTSQEQLQRLLEGTESPSQKDRLATVTETLSNSLEELQVSIEELKQQQEELDKVYETALIERQHYQNLFEFAPDAYLVTNLYGGIEKANQAAINLFNLKPGLIVGKSVTSFITYSQRTFFRKYFAQLSYCPQRSNWTTTIEPRKKEACHAELSFAPIYEKQQLKGWLISVRDLTEKEEAEENRKNLIIEKELNELKSHFLRTISHDFRTPLNVIYVSSQLLQRLNITPEFKLQLHEKVGNSIRQMTRMMEDVLCLTKSQFEMQMLRSQLLNPKDIILQLIEEQTFLTDCTDRIQFQCEPDSCHIEGDPDLIKQIFGNLLSNALKYSPDDSKVIIKLSQTEEDILFTVIDEGIGIPKTDQERLFESFYRAGNVASIPGTGLGMAIVKKSVDLHQGEITFESEDGYGSTFRVKLPKKVNKTTMNNRQLPQEATESSPSEPKQEEQHQELAQKHGEIGQKHGEQIEEIGESIEEKAETESMSAHGNAIVQHGEEVEAHSNSYLEATEAAAQKNDQSDQSAKDELVRATQEHIAAVEAHLQSTKEVIAASNESLENMSQERPC